MLSDNQVIYVVDDEPEVCNAIKWLFESINFKVKTYSNAQLFLDDYDKTSQGCLITDVRLPGSSGLALLEELKQQKSKLPVILITGYGDIPMAVRAMKAGALDFILKPFNEQCLLEIVQNCLSNPYQNNSYELTAEKINKLSPREKQIIELLLDGKLNKQIAHELSISISTVEAHRANIMHKMEAKNFAQLIKMYLEIKFNLTDKV